MHTYVLHSMLYIYIYMYVYVHMYTYMYMYICLPGNPKDAKCLYSADLSSKNVCVKAKRYFYDLLCRQCIC